MMTRSRERGRRRPLSLKPNAERNAIPMRPQLVALILVLIAWSVLAQEETARCSDCHDQAKAFVSNPHARGQLEKGEVPNAVCESCHGDGAAHIEAGGDKEKIVVPRGLTGAEDTCRTCHDLTTNRRSHSSGAHANSEKVHCLTCHSIHSAQEQAYLVARPQLELCAACHTQPASFRNKPYTHRLRRGGLSCTSCHDPHARPGRDNLKVTAGGELPCLGCHTDKRGPFVFAHGGAAIGDCMNCHQPHGSNNPKQLTRAHVFQLCLECHSPIGGDTLGSQPPAFHNLNSPRYRNCTTCHVAIHGSHRSPQLLK